MKVLVTSDLHIHSWTKFSTLDKYGRPDRLLKYLGLAKDLCELSAKEECDAIILAGDISERCIQPPHVLDIIGDFLREISGYCPVYLIHGQHDLNTKTDSISYENSILKEICKDLEESNVYYFGNTEVVEIDGIKVLFQPWTDSHLIPNKKADVFVGHGLVSGTSNLDGHVFSSGFSSEELTSNFKLSIIGDIHNGQVIENSAKSSKILIPGSPIQNTWKDAHNCGVWIAEVSKEEEPVLKFFNIHELHPDFYHQFIYDKQSTELIHSRPLIRTEKSKSKNKEEIKLERSVDTIFDTCLRVIDEDKVGHPNRVKSSLKEAFDNTKRTEDKVISNTQIKSIRIKNFLSIDEFNLDFSEIPHACVIVGANGSGKTSLPEAIYWCLTGSTTKGIALSNIVNTFTEEESCFVEVTLEIGSNLVVVTRRRELKTSSLELEQNGQLFNRGSIRETQQEIYDLLGLTDWQIKMFSYFSAKETSLFAGLGDSAKNDLLSQIVGLTMLDSIRDYAKTKKTYFKEEILKAQGSVSSLNFQISNLQSKLSKLALELNSDSKESLNKEIVSLRNKISSIKEKFQEDQLLQVSLMTEAKAIDSSILGLEEIQKRVSEYSNSANKLTNTINSINTNRVRLTTSLNLKKNELKTANSGHCYTCKQELKNEEVLNQVKEEVKELLTELNSLPNSQELETEYKNLEVKLGLLSEVSSKLVRVNNEINKKKTEIINLNTQIQTLSFDLQKEKQDTGILEHIRQELTQSENEKSKYDGLLLEYQVLQDVWKYIEVDLLKKKGSLIKKLNEQGAILIQKCVSELLSDTPFDVKIEEDLKILGKFYNSKWMNYESLSSGQQRVIDIILMVAMNNLFSKLYGLTNGVLGLTVYDEILSFLDPEYVEVSKGIVDQSVSSKILMITHDENLINMYDSKISVTMGKSGSIYKKSW